MIVAELVFGAPTWRWPATVAVTVALVAVLWSYGRAGSPGWVRALAGALKAAGVIALGICLVEPLFSGMRPRPQANLFLLLADDSASLQIRDRSAQKTRAQVLKDRLAPASGWQTRISQDFDVRRYAFGTRLRPVEDFGELTMEDRASELGGSLLTIAQRYHGRPMAGLLLLTDGNATDLDEPVDWTQLPPVYPVVLGDDEPAPDISVTRVWVGQTNFEAAPVTVLAEVTCHGFSGQPVLFQLRDESGAEVARHVAPQPEDGKRLVHRFLLRPEKKGVSFYRVRAFAQSEQAHWEQDDRPEETAEATSLNNTRPVVVDRGGGPFRVLYVSGRPNWELKFLRRSLEEDEEVQLVGLVRMAKREPKFTFRGRQGETTNPFFRGFGENDDVQTEQYDEPVLLRLGTEDKEELRGGFPTAADQLFRYDALILDDVEAGFFTQDQLSLIEQFVSQRGGGLLMLGGQASLENGDYQRTSIGQLLPVYLDRPDKPSPDEGYRLGLSRDGWLLPWIRLRSTEREEEKRLEQMPAFKTVHRLPNIKPGATVLAYVESRDGNRHPALVTQTFGKGRSAALLVGDLWRWQFPQETSSDDDLQKCWRQMVRWLVGNVPQRVDVEIKQGDVASMPIQLRIDARDEVFSPLDNATAKVEVTTPDGRVVELTAEPADQQAGQYVATFFPPVAGPCRVRVEVTGADGSQVGQRHGGFVAEPDTDEFRTLTPNRALLQRIAEKTGGQMVQSDRLEEFAGSLSRRKVPMVEPWIYPLWHQWTVFVFAVVCLVSEWGLRRFRGLP